MRPWAARRLFRFPSRTPDDIRADIDDEVAFHLAMRTEALRQEGATAADARAQALREFGDPDRHQEATAPVALVVERRARARRWLEEFAQDSRVGLRLLARSPGFTVDALRKAMAAGEDIH